MSDNAKRLNKFISETGFCSRREADRLIEQGRVTINGKIPEMGTKVSSEDEVLVDGKPLREKRKALYIALNKPTGVTCTTERDIPGNIVDFIGHKERIFPIGRLDKPSDGLIFLTNDGDIVNKILRAGNNHEKEYVVRVDRPITPEFLKKMASGVPILDTVTLPCEITKESEYSFRIVLTQGLNRQIRRMCEALDYRVFKLRRVRIMNITIDGIPNGKWRYLSDDEVKTLLELSGDSVGTEEASVKDAQGRRIRKATDAKLYDSREENQASRARRNRDEQKQVFDGKFTPSRHRPKGNSSTGKPSGHKSYAKPKANPTKPSEGNKPRVKGKLSLKK
ncbi:23S rRNA pseudouridine(2604) synthase RluF [Vibrio breoganii]|uniref:23S rRNA pseudouridine(2604) synthase RluF n=1 Tax=Vibrio breoganii TaxID=553239 RepID=UPI0002ECBEEA|nr:23S rRNA pseudouridine(2604) synthase RluF [Vibrio breoganii]OEF81078.1 23S rRNA pseudouridine synthase F [Vibrio breoganii 1C10]TKF87241.1 23S rRNA pseudouridine(2604) synthase RluF [Vibrio breoganii]